MQMLKFSKLNPLLPTLGGALSITNKHDKIMKATVLEFTWPCEALIWQQRHLLSILVVKKKKIENGTLKSAASANKTYYGKQN